MADVRKYEVKTCPDCGSQVQVEPADGGIEESCTCCAWSAREDFERGRPRRKALAATAIDARDVEPLVKALGEAIDMVHDWASYASEYFQEKHDLEGDLAALRAARQPFLDAFPTQQDQPEVAIEQQQAGKKRGKQ